MTARAMPTPRPALCCSALVAALLALSGCGGDSPETGAVAPAAQPGSAGSAGSAGSGPGGSGGSSGKAGASGSPVAGAGGSGGSSGKGSAGGGGAGGGGSSGAAGCGAGGASCGEVGANGACSGGTLRYCSPPLPGGCSPVLEETSCPAGCVVENGVASCKQAGCSPGEARCGGDDGNTLLVCKADGSGYDATPCGSALCEAAPGAQASCSAPSSAGGVLHTLSGCITFEFRKLAKVGLAASPDVNVAYYAHVGVYTYGKLIGKAVTGPDGCFQAKLTDEPSPDTDVYIYPYDADPSTGKGRLAVVKDPPSMKPVTSTAYWQWSNKTDGCPGLKAAVVPDATGFGKHTIGDVDHNGDGKPDLLIPESCGSGAMQIYNWARYAMRLLGDPADGLSVTKAKKQASVAVFWTPGVDAFCGACFLGKAAGGVTIKPADGPPEAFDTAVLLSGSDARTSHWSPSVIAHEMGHWAQENYSRPSGEVGDHLLEKLSTAGLAYSEGWSTAFGQHVVGDSFYLTRIGGVTYWVDIASATWSGGLLPKPSPSGPIDQKLNENVVAGAIWHLWKPSGVDVNGPYQALGSEKIFTALQSKRLTSGTIDRGYPTPDLLDFFDAALCEKVASYDQVGAVVSGIDYPWDSTASCP